MFVLYILLITTWEIHRAIQRNLPSQQRTLVLKRTLMEGERIQLVDLGISSGHVSGAGNFTDQDLHVLKGARARRKLLAGSVLRKDSIALSPQVIGLARSVPRGYRAYQLMLSQRLFVQPGDLVDILFRPQDPLPTRVLIEGAEVLQVRTGTESSLLVVAVHRNDLEALEKARQQGKLTIALRNPKDRTLFPKRRKKRKKPKRKRIEILTEE